MGKTIEILFIFFNLFIVFPLKVTKLQFNAEIDVNLFIEI